MLSRTPYIIGTTVIDKLVPPGPKPPRQVVIEQYPPLPPKPQDVIIERWLPTAPRQRRILYERLPPSAHPVTRPIIVQYGPPHVRIQREIIAAPGAPLPYQQVAGHTDIHQVINQLGGGQQLHSSVNIPFQSDVEVFILFMLSYPSHRWVLTIRSHPYDQIIVHLVNLNRMLLSCKADNLRHLHPHLMEHHYHVFVHRIK